MCTYLIQNFQLTKYSSIRIKVVENGLTKIKNIFNIRSSVIVIDIWTIITNYKC